MQLNTRDEFSWSQLNMKLYTPLHASSQVTSYVSICSLHGSPQPYGFHLYREWVINFTSFWYNGPVGLAGALIVSLHGFPIHSTTKKDVRQTHL